MKSYEQFKEDLENLDEIFGFGKRRKERLRKEKLKKYMDKTAEREREEKKEKLSYMKKRDEKPNRSGYEVISGIDAAPAHNVSYVHPKNLKDGRPLLITKKRKGV